MLRTDSNHVPLKHKSTLRSYLPKDILSIFVNNPSSDGMLPDNWLSSKINASWRRKKKAKFDVEVGFQSCYPPNINLLYGRTYPTIRTQDLSTIPARIGCFLTIDYYLISMHHEDVERKQNWMLRTADSNPPNINLLYGRTYPAISTQDLLTIPARMVFVHLDHYPLWCIINNVSTFAYCEILNQYHTSFNLPKLFHPIIHRDNKETRMCEYCTSCASFSFLQLTLETIQSLFQQHNKHPNKFH